MPAKAKATSKKAVRKGRPAKGPTPKTVNTARAAAASPTPPKAARPARLGDELQPEPAPRLSREPVSIVVARSHVVAGGVRMKSEAPSVLHVAAGQVVHVKHAYRFQEASPEKEEYRFLLKSRLGGVAHPPSLARLGDRWGLPEDVGGYLQHEHTLSQPGRTTLEFEAGAEYCAMDWGASTVQALDRKDLKGRIDVIVG